MTTTYIVHLTTADIEKWITEKFVNAGDEVESIDFNIGTTVTGFGMNEIEQKFLSGANVKVKINHPDL
jgi:hypothetical protein